MRLNLIACIFFFVGVTVSPQVWAASRGGGAASHQLELNARYGLVFSNPGSLNDLVTSRNASATARLSEIKNLTAMGGEVLYVFSRRFSLGGRYTQLSGTTGTGTSGGQPLELKVQTTDVTLVARYQFGSPDFGTSFGFSGGTATDFRVTDRISGATSDYTASNVTVIRAFLSPRINWGAIGLFIEGGYQILKAPEVKNSAGFKLTSPQGASEIDLSGPYAVGGLGINL